MHDLNNPQLTGRITGIEDPLPSSDPSVLKKSNFEFDVAEYNAIIANYGSMSVMLHTLHLVCARLNINVNDIKKSMTIPT